MDSPHRPFSLYYFFQLIDGLLSVIRSVIKLTYCGPLWRRHHAQFNLISNSNHSLSSIRSQLFVTAHKLYYTVASTSYLMSCSIPMNTCCHDYLSARSNRKRILWTSQVDEEAALAAQNEQFAHLESLPRSKRLLGKQWRMNVLICVCIIFFKYGCVFLTTGPKDSFIGGLLIIPLFDIQLSCCTSLGTLRTSRNMSISFSCLILIDLDLKIPGGKPLLPDVAINELLV